MDYKKKKTQITKIINKSEDITADSTEMKRLVRQYHKQQYAKNMDNLDEMDKFLET